MSSSRKILVFGGLALAALGMLYGLYYAVLVEHQTLDRIGGALASAFLAAASGHPAESDSALAVYRETKYDYVRQVDVHSHWIGLAMLLIILGAVFDRLGFSERTRFSLALALLTGSVVFPLGVILETSRRAKGVAAGLAVIGSAMIIMALAVVAVGFTRQKAGPNPAYPAG